MRAAYVRRFFAMPEPSSDASRISHVRQVAREAVVAAAPGTHLAAPVHINFPFDEPLTPDLQAEDLFSNGQIAGGEELPAAVLPERIFSPHDSQELAAFLEAHRVVVLAGEGTFSAQALTDHARRDREAQALLAFAERFDAPLLADPLSQLRQYQHPAVICGYDRIMASDDMPAFDAVVRFGRYPVSKRAAQVVEVLRPAQIVVDPLESRDFNSQTTTLVVSDPLDFVVAMLEAAGDTPGALDIDASLPRNIHEWGLLDRARSSLPRSIHEWGLLDRARSERILSHDFDSEPALEGSYVRALLEELPAESLLFSANSMSVRALDAFYVSNAKRITVLANRGLNGIDGTVSTAIGAAQEHSQTVLLTGDLSLLHDLNALALQGEMLLRERDGSPRPSVLVVLLNNNGGAIFDMLPQKSDDPYFERLFLTPQKVDFLAAAQSFGVSAKRATTPQEFRELCQGFLGKPGISLIEVPLPLAGVKERYGRF